MQSRGRIGIIVGRRTRLSVTAKVVIDKDHFLDTIEPHFRVLGVLLIRRDGGA